jgi:predicted nucleic acid-binding protein
MPVDARGLPRRLLLDSSVLIPALRRKKGDEPCAELFEALVASKVETLIAAPTVAEMMKRKPPRSLPHVRTIEVVAFDQAAAMLLGGDRFPHVALTKFKEEGAGAVHYFKYDMLILACAVRHRAECIVTHDRWQTKIASEIGLPAKTAADYQGRQLTFPT